MPVFKTYAQLEKVVESIAKDALDEVARDVFYELYEFIQKAVYEDQVLRSIKSDIEPTREFIESLRRECAVRIGNNTYQTKIFFDPSRINAYKREDRRFNTHMSVNGGTMWNNKDISELMPKWIDEGNGNSPYYHYDGIKFMKFITKYIEDNYDTLLKNALKKRGLKLR